jgi:hypothetical protein
MAPELAAAPPDLTGGEQYQPPNRIHGGSSPWPEGGGWDRPDAAEPGAGRWA